MADQKQEIDYSDLQDYVDSMYNGDYQEYAFFLRSHAFRLCQHALKVDLLKPDEIGIIAKDIDDMAESLLCIHITNTQK